MIAKRIREIASLIGKDCSVTDIGCDHGYLAICLRQAGNDCKIICCDNKKGPLDNCRNNLAYLQDDKISYVLSDGIAQVDEISDVAVMAGMGYRTIVKIIENDYDRFKKYSKLIIQSNNSLPQLRRWLNQKGFAIECEHLVYDDIYYFIILAHPGNQQLSEDEYLFGKDLLSHQRGLFEDYLNHQLAKKTAILAGIKPDSGAHKRIANEIQKIRELL